MEFGSDYIVRPIQSTDSLIPFKTGSQEFQPLKAFLRNQAIEFQLAMVAQTYVCILLEDGEDKGKVIGYLTLTCSELDIKNGYELSDCPYANQYDSLPAVKIARLAIDARYRGNKLGKMFVALALDVTTQDIYPTVGCRFLITDAKANAVAFYKTEGFSELNTVKNLTSPNPVMFIDLFKTLNE